MAVAVGRLPELFEFLKPLQLGKLTLAAAIIAVLVNHKHSNEVLKTELGKRMVLFSVLGVLSLAFSIYGPRTLYFLEMDLLRIVLLFFLVAKTATNSRTLAFYLYVFAILLAMMSVLGLLNATGARVEFSQSYDPNDIGLVVLTISALFLGISTDTQHRFHRLILVLSLAGFAVVLSTQSRGAFLGLCAVGLYFSLARKRVENGRFYSAPNPRIVVGMLVAFAFVFAITPESSWDRILTIFELEEDYNTTANRGRVAIWERGLESLFTRPWGAGGGAYQSVDLRLGGAGLTAHNSFLQVAVELGIAGLLIYVSMYRSAWRTSRSMLLMRDDVRLGKVGVSLNALGLGIRCAVVGFLVSGFFLSMGYGRVFYSLLGLIAAYELFIRRAETSQAGEPDDETSRRGVSGRRSVLTKNRVRTPPSRSGLQRSRDGSEGR